jgi:hypothetical protein
MSPPLLPAGHIECLEMEILVRTTGHNENPPLLLLMIYIGFLLRRVRFHHLITRANSQVKMITHL